MPPKPRIAYFAHSLRSDWNNGNAHFLRGLLRGLVTLGHDVTIHEPAHDWSIDNLLDEPLGPASLAQFAALYPDLRVDPYDVLDTASWHERLAGVDIVILHEWNPPALARRLLALRDDLGFRLLFHDTHHRASSSPEQIELFGIARFDGVLAFGQVLRDVYRNRFGMDRVWVLHEAADTTVFKPIPHTPPVDDLVWIGNWGDDERSAEIAEFLLEPAASLPQHTFTIYGVRYPDAGLRALATAGVRYGGYLPNLDAPAIYGAARLTMHIPRRQYATRMTGIPTIRVFEALACGIPLISAPWLDTEELFRPGDYLSVRNGAEMRDAIASLLHDEPAAHAQSARGLETVRARHTCDHRAAELSALIEAHLL